VCYFYRYVDSHKGLRPFYTGLRKTVRTPTFLSIKLPVPPVYEQKAIASFLDAETSKIDALVSEQRRLIELLKEKRQAVISHAVTKGLNPNAPMKPSGIQWLGDVPQHWSVHKLKRAFRSVDYGISESLSMEGDVAILRMGNIQDGQIDLADLKYVSEVEEELLLVEGDLLYNRTNSLDLIGKVGMFLGDSDIPVSFASYLVRLRTTSKSTTRFFAYLLNTEGILGLARASAFVAIGQCNLNPTRYGMLSVAVPPLSEQEEIADYLDDETSRLSSLEAEAERAIELLQERRTALISAAVTGKIDVREFAYQETA
jgi:type I restriction enzyme S subunit